MHLLLLYLRGLISIFFKCFLTFVKINYIQKIMSEYVKQNLQIGIANS